MRNRQSLISFKQLGRLLAYPSSKLLFCLTIFLFILGIVYFALFTNQFEPFVFLLFFGIFYLSVLIMFFVLVRWIVNLSTIHGEKINEIEGLFSRQIDDLSKDIRDVHNNLNTNVKIIRDEFKRIDDLSKDINDVRNNLNTNVKIIHDEFKRIEYQSNTNMIRNIKLGVHCRVITKDDYFIAETKWSKLRQRDEHLRPSEYVYMAKRVIDIERKCNGRLATSIQAMLLRILVAQSIKSENLNILEIGTLFGINLAILYECCFSFFQNINMTTIDPLSGYYDKKLRDEPTGVGISRVIFNRNMAICNIPSNSVNCIEMLSTDKEAIGMASKTKYNFLLIDGDHSYAGIEADYQNYKSLVEKDGYIIFDDYGNVEWNDVKAFVDEVAANDDELTFYGHDWNTAVFKVN